MIDRDEGILEFDLDAAREERAKKRADSGWVPPVLRFGGESFTLPDEMPAEVLYLVVDGDARAALRVLLGGDFDRFWGLGPTRDDLPALIIWVVSAYNRPASNGRKPGPLPAKTPAKAARPRPRKRAGG